MVSSLFESLLKDFEPIFNCALVPDENQSCLITTSSGITVQIELNSEGKLIIGSKLGVLKMSAYRIHLLKEALKSNDAALPHEGIFGYSTKSNQLILFLTIDTNQLNSEKIKTLLPPFLIKAKKWLDAISAGQIPSSEQKSNYVSPMGIFSPGQKK
jgi:hypothetical protein